MLEKVVMRLLCVFMVCCFLQGCETTDYYFMVEGEKEITSSMLYKTENLAVFFRVYNGNISRLKFSVPKGNENLEVEVLKYKHSLIVNKNFYNPSIIGDYGLGVLNFQGNRQITITSKLVLDEKPESLIEAIVIEMLVEGDLITISKDFQLMRGSFSRFDALMNM